MNIEDEFIDGMNKEVTDQVDDAAKHDIKKAVVEICWDAEKTIQLSGNAIDFVQLSPNLVPHLLCRVAIFIIVFIIKCVSFLEMSC